jgi:hypothetical protein
MTFQESSNKDSIDGNETSIMNIDSNMKDIKYYVGTSYILES